MVTTTPPRTAPDPSINTKHSGHGGPPSLSPSGLSFAVPGASLNSLASAHTPGSPGPEPPYFILVLPVHSECSRVRKAPYTNVTLGILDLKALERKAARARTQKNVVTARFTGSANASRVCHVPGPGLCGQRDILPVIKQYLGKYCKGEGPGCSGQGQGGCAHSCGG